MMPFLSDRRVLATSAAVITVAILAFLVGTFPAWRQAIGVDKPDVASLMQPGGSALSANSPNGQSSMDAPVAAGHDAAAIAGSSAASPSGTPGAQATQDTAKGQEATATTGSKAPANMAALEPADQPGTVDQNPTFDIVRVEPSGDSVIAGRAKPGADIVLLDQGQPIARAKADASGQVAFVPPALAPGEHSLMLSVGEPTQNGAVSSQSVAVSVPVEGKTAPMVALIAPGQPTRVLSGQTPAAPSGSGPGASAAPAIAVSTIDVEDQGGIYATGKAAPDSHCRIYLNGSFVAAVTAGKDGVWSFKIKRGMRPGRYSVRVDQLQSAAGQVQARAEVPFDYPDSAADVRSLLRPKVAPKVAAGAVPPTGGSAVVAGGNGAPAPPDAAMASPSAPAQPATHTMMADASASQAISGAGPTIVPQLLTTKVIRGDSLWRISRKMLGQGLRYTQIYAANTAQIRNPKLIYPGQIFVMPQSAP